MAKTNRFELGEVFPPEVHVSANGAALHFGKQDFVGSGLDSSACFPFPLQGDVDKLLRILQSENGEDGWYLVLEHRTAG